MKVKRRFAKTSPSRRRPLLRCKIGNLMQRSYGTGGLVSIMLFQFFFSVIVKTDGLFAALV